VAGRDRAGSRTGRRLASSGARPRGSCIRAALPAACGGKSSGDVEGGGRGRGGTSEATRRVHEAQRGPLGHNEERGVLGLGYMGLVGSNIYFYGLHY
jgi:hypothetical protein